MDNTISFKTFHVVDVSDELFDQCAKLYSENYGVYSDKVAISGKQQGDPVTMGKSFMKKHYGETPECNLVVAYKGDALVGQAFYLRKNYTRIGTMTWVLQLVVKKEYRNKKIGQRLRHSIWGFSNDVAWGLATANPYTVRTLEAATFRRVTPKMVNKHLDKIKTIANDIWFAKDAELIVNEEHSFIDTSFPVNHSENKITEPWLLGELPEGQEWLAFTFKSQDVDPDIFEANYPDLIEFSEERLNDAYSRMKMSDQAWAAGTPSEVDFIVEKCGLEKDDRILDIGCGIGRHSLELSRRGYGVRGLDYSERHLRYAEKIACEENLSVKFTQQDCRDEEFFKKEEIFEKYDVAICLYDVVGSFPEDDKNTAIIRNAYNALKNGGCFVLSVMNYELTANCAKYKIKNIQKDPKIFLNLKPSDIMQKSGNVFDPEYYLVEEDTHVIFRKEQFSDDGNIPAEYVIRDRRYKKDEIKEIVQKVGFEILEEQFLSAGRWNKPYTKGTDLKAKEILLICKKKCPAKQSHGLKKLIEKFL